MESKELLPLEPLSEDLLIAIAFFLMAAFSALCFHIQTGFNAGVNLFGGLLWLYYLARRVNRIATRIKHRIY